jgi:predicted nucleic acid-binding protein
MSGELLLDTGALVSLLDRSQRFHRACVQTLEAWTAPVVSTEAVLTEATHLLGRVRGGRRACLDFFLSGAAVLVPSTPASLRRCRALLDQYADLPMDFADATLVVLAEEIGTNLIFTTDRRDFDVYRIGKRRRFRVLPGQA